MAITTFSCELFYYLEEICKDKKHQDFYYDFLKSMDLSQYKRGTVVNSIRAVTHKDHYNRGLFWWGTIEKAKLMVK